MKSYSAIGPPLRQGSPAPTLLTPVDPADIGTEDFGCHLCGAVFIRRATRDYIRRVGFVYCGKCAVWSQVENAS